MTLRFQKVLSGILVTVMMLVLMASITSVSADTGLSSDKSLVEQSIIETIDGFMSSDGADAEQLSDEMLKQFLLNSDDFIQIISKYPADDQTKILKRIASTVVGSSVEKRLSFEEIIYASDDRLPYISEIEGYYTKALKENEPQSIANDAPIYDMETVEQMVDAYLASDEGNEEFFNYLYNVYQAEPELLEEKIVQYTQTDIQELAQGLANVYRANGIPLNKSSKNGYLSKQILGALNQTSEDITKQNGVTPYAVYTPQITSFSYTKKVEVGTPVPLSLKLTESSGTSVARTYTVKVFCTRSGTEWQVATTTMTIPAGSTTATKNINITFSHAGTFTTRVAIYNGSTLLTTRSGRNPDISYGKWKVTVTFQKDRTKYGTFALYNAAGEQQVSGSALGRGQNNLPENEQYGNTPCGEYRGSLGGPHSNTESFGPNKYIKTFAVNVPAIQKYGRTDAMWIHGGRSQTTLQWTDGCVRVFNDSMLSMQNSITEMSKAENGHYTEGTVIYREQ